MKIAYYAAEQVRKLSSSGKYEWRGTFSGIVHPVGDRTRWLHVTEGHTTAEAALAAAKQEWEEKE